MEENKRNILSSMTIWSEQEPGNTLTGTGKIQTMTEMSIFKQKILFGYLNLVIGICLVIVSCILVIERGY